MRSIYTYDIQFIAFFINTYNMCMQVVECCGKNPQDAPSFHSYVSSVPEFRVRHKKSPFIFYIPLFIRGYKR